MPAVYGLLVVMAVFFVVGFFGLSNEIVSWFAWPISPAWIYALKPWQMLTYSFVPGGIWALLFNAIILYFLGGSLERAWGTPRFIAFFFLSGIVAGLSVLALTFLIPSLPGGFFVGLTGHTVALFVAFAAINPYATIYFNFLIPIQARWFALIGTLLELFTQRDYYGSTLAAVVAIAMTALFSWAFTRGIRFGPRGGGGGPSLRDRFERWRQRQRMRAWQRKVSKIDKPEDLFK
jgi:membrane associated rhomboid family serine protease